LEDIIQATIIILFGFFERRRWNFLLIAPALDSFRSAHAGGIDQHFVV
jgi:hypothetical protein